MYHCSCIRYRFRECTERVTEELGRGAGNSFSSGFPAFEVEFEELR
jgi:hypothetical protein